MATGVAALLRTINWRSVCRRGFAAAVHLVGALGFAMLTGYALAQLGGVPGVSVPPEAYDLAAAYGRLIVGDMPASIILALFGFMCMWHSLRGLTNALLPDDAWEDA